jgi:ABC-type Fe3+-hydroxamate transport system substrate-binding protein
MHRACLFVLCCAMLWFPGSLAALEPSPQRIISLAPSITREIYDLGAQDMLIGVTLYRPDEAQSKEIVGTLTKLNFEKIFSLMPDLILASKDSNTKTDIEKLKALGLNVVVFEGCISLSGIFDEFERLGSLLGKKPEADEILRDVQKKIDHIRSSIRVTKPVKVYWQMGSSPLVSISDTTFPGEYIRLAGCENIFADAPANYPRINIEEVIARNPDVILMVAEMESDRVQALWSTMEEINAVKNGRVYTLKADLVCQPTPRMFVKGFEAVVKRLYPGAL